MTVSLVVYVLEEGYTVVVSFVDFKIGDYVIEVDFSEIRVVFHKILESSSFVSMFVDG